MPASKMSPTSSQLLSVKAININSVAKYVLKLFIVVSFMSDDEPV